MQLSSTAIFKRFVFPAFFLAPIFGVGQNTLIQGQAPDYSNSRVLVYAEADGLSGKRVLLSSGKVDADGAFKVEFDIERTTPVMLDIDHVVGEMLVHPDKRYTVFFPPLEKEQVRSFSGTSRVELYFDNPAADDINLLISDINYAVDSFLIAEVAKIGSRDFSKRLQSLENQLQQRFGNHPNEYVQMHQRYAMALTEFSTRAYTRRDLFERHLDAKQWTPHPTFFEFLRTFFQRYFENFGANYGPELIPETMKLSSPGGELLELMKKDEFLRSDTLREMVAIHALAEAYHKDLSTIKVVQCLDFIAQHGSTPFNREAAANTKARLTATAVGFEAPELTFLNQYNESVSLSDFRGKHIYLEFISTWCSDCPRDQSLLPDLQAEYGDVVEIITVVVDSERQDFQKYLSRNPDFSWNILYDPTGYEAQDTYNVRSLPWYFLIGPDGNFVQSPAASPTGGIVERLYPILQKARESQRLKVGE